MNEEEDNNNRMIEQIRDSRSRRYGLAASYLVALVFLRKVKPLLVVLATLPQIPVELLELLRKFLV